MRALVGGLVVAGVAFATPAWAHEPDNREAHREMPHDVTAGVTVACPAYYRAKHVDLERPDAEDFETRGVSASGALCVGAEISFAREIGRHFELRLRLAYDKPILFDDVFELNLHHVRGTIGPSAVVRRFDDVLTLRAGAEIGAAGYIMEEVRPSATAPEGLASASAWGLYVGGNATVQANVTYHTGFFAQVGFGRAFTWSDDFEMMASGLGRVTLGWSDRF